jgi:hypothetical protein
MAVVIHANAPEKMSKSRHNVVTPDEVVFAVYDLQRGYEFRTIDGIIREPLRYGIWRNKGGDGFYYTSSQTGRQPVFLCRTGHAETCVLMIDGEERMQHPKLLATLPD